MLLEFSCSNFKAIREPMTFSMVGSKDKSNIDELYDFEDLKVLRTAIVYGSNGSGKTTLIEAIGYFKNLVLKCNNFQEGDKIPRPYHKLEKDKTTTFDIQFVIAGLKYAYGFGITDTKVSEEYLYHFPQKRQAKIFERKNNEFTFGTKYKKELNEITSKSKSNKLFLNTAEAWSSLNEIINPFTFFKNQLVVHADNHNNWFMYSAKKINDDLKMKNILINFLQKIGLPVKDIMVKIDKDNSFSDSNDIPMELMEIFNRFKTNTISVEVKFIYEDYELNINEESLGTQKLFELICPLIDILLTGKSLFYDELENSLHPIILRELIEVFKEWNEGQAAQLIFSTHDTSLLDLNLFRRDQIWFSERNPKICSAEYYSLVELKNVRKDENIKKGFVRGRYSSIPLNGSSLIEILEG